MIGGLILVIAPKGVSWPTHIPANASDSTLSGLQESARRYRFPDCISESFGVPRREHRQQWMPFDPAFGSCYHRNARGQRPQQRTRVVFYESWLDHVSGLAQPHARPVGKFN